MNVYYCLDMRVAPKDTVDFVARFVVSSVETDPSPFLEPRGIALEASDQRLAALLEKRMAGKHLARVYTAINLIVELLPLPDQEGLMAAYIR